MSGVYYKDCFHRDVLLSWLEKSGKVYVKYRNKIDIDYLPALYVLTSDKELRDKCLRFIDHEGIDFPLMKKTIDFSSGYRVLVDLAHHLFNSGCDVSPMAIIRNLDGDNFEVAMQAICLRRHSVRLIDL